MAGRAFQIDIGPATPLHRAFIEAGVRATFSAHARDNPRHFSQRRLSPFLANIERGLDGRGPDYLVALHHAEPIGYVSQFVLGRTRTIQDIFVAPAQRRRGVAGALLNHVVGMARANGAGLIHATVWDGNDASLALFRSAGFSAATPLLPDSISRLFPGLRSTGLFLTLP